MDFRIAFILGAIIGVALGLIILLIKKTVSYQGVLEIDKSEPDKDKWLFVLTIPPEKIFKYDSINVLVKDVTQLVQQSKRSKDAE